MLKTTLGRTGLEVSRVIYPGILNLGQDLDLAKQYVEYALKIGVNYFDVAPSYGNAETRLGPAIEPYRDQITLACKTTERTAEGSKRELLQSLENLKTDHFDIYQLHSLTTMEDIRTVFAPGGALETYLWAKEQGIVNFIGFSAHNEEVALEACRQYDFDTILFPLNWALNLVHGWGDRLMEVAKASNKGVIGMKTMVDRQWRSGEEKVYPNSWCRPIFDNDKLLILAARYGVAMGADVMVPPGNFEFFNFMYKHQDEIWGEPLTEEELLYLKAEAFKIKDELIFDPRVRDLELV